MWIARTGDGAIGGARHRPRTNGGPWLAFGAICPAEGKGAGIVMPFCDTPAMQEHLTEISAMVAPDAHAVLILDKAGWRLARALVVPDNITILPLSPRSPEPNPVENLRQFLRDNWLSNRVFKGYDDVVAHCCVAWNDLVDQPWRIRSIGKRPWAEGFRSMQVGISRLLAQAMPIAWNLLAAPSRLNRQLRSQPAASVSGAPRASRRDTKFG